MADPKRHMVIGGTGPVAADQRRPHGDWIHTALVQGQAVREFTKFDDQPASIAGAIDSILRAHEVATTQPAGPVYLCFDAGLQEARLPEPVEIPDHSAFPAIQQPHAGQETLRRIADLLLAADKPAIPIRLTAVATQPDLGVLVWVLGEHRAIPQNYLHVQINEARIDWFNGGFNYNEVVSEAADEADGQAFATDYAGSSKIMGDRLYQEGRYDLDALRIIEDPPTFVSTLLRQGFPRDNQMQALLRRHIPMPPAVLEEGVLEIVFGGDQKAYDSALADGFLQSIAESSFYNNMEAYTAYLDEIDFAPDLFADALAETIVEPLRRSQVLFAEHPFLTRLFTTLSASEMTLDPVFSFNPDLPPVDNVRTAQAHWECPNGDPEEIPPEDIVLIITLNDGRQIRTNPFNGVEPIPLASAGPAARLIERLEDSGPPILIRRPTDITEESGNETLPLTTALLPNYPNPFNSGTVIPFQVPDITADTRVSLHIFNLLGQPVRRLLQERTRPGLHQVSWDGHNDQGHAVPSGVYIYRLDVGTQRHTRKLLLLR